MSMFCGMPAHDHSEFDAGVEALAEEMNNDMGEIDVHQLKARIDEGDDLYILDVRNPVEWEIVALDNAHATHRIPKPDIEAALNAIKQGRSELADTIIADIPDDREVIVHCRSGVRSADVIGILRELGYKNDLKNLTGGILAWANEIDTSLPTY
jgi:rhodanese-related sulfurtransferase